MPLGRAEAGKVGVAEGGEQGIAVFCYTELAVAGGFVETAGAFFEEKRITTDGGAAVAAAVLQAELASSGLGVPADGFCHMAIVEADDEVTAFGGAGGFEVDLG